MQHPCCIVLTRGTWIVFRPARGLEQVHTEQGAPTQLSVAIVVQIEGKVSRQSSGGAMGTNCLPQAAQLYIAVKWEGVLKRKFGSRFPEVFKRFIDDGFVLFDGSKDELLAFIDALQNELPNINISCQML